MVPVLIYFFKCPLAISSEFLGGFEVPIYLKLYNARDSIFYIYKTAYTGFSLPPLAVSIYALYRGLINEDLKISTYLMLIINILLIETMYY